jgi:hypothetical protein
MINYTVDLVVNIELQSHVIPHVTCLLFLPLWCSVGRASEACHCLYKHHHWFILDGLIRLARAPAED